MRPNNFGISQSLLKEKCERLIKGELANLKRAVISGSLDYYMSMVEQILEDSIGRTTVGKDQEMAVRAFIYNYPLGDNDDASWSSTMDNNTALHFAAVNGHADFVRTLGTKFGVDVNQLNSGSRKDAVNWTPLHFAAKRGFHKVVEALLEDCAARPHISKKDGWTPLHLAINNYIPSPNAMTNHEIVCQTLIDFGAESSTQNAEGERPDTMTPCTGYRNPILAGLVSKTPKQVRRPKVISTPQVILKNLIDQQNSSGASKQNSSGISDYVADHPNWYKETIDGSSVLHYAARECRADFFGDLANLYMRDAKTGTLLKAVSEPDYKGLQPIHFAAGHGNSAVLETLLAIGVSVNTFGGNNNQTPLHLAATLAQSTFAYDTLIGRGADLALADRSGRRADQVGHLLENPVRIKVGRLFAAIKSGETGTLSEFLAGNPTWLSVTNDDNLFPQELAIRVKQFSAFIQAYANLEARYQTALNLKDRLNQRNTNLMDRISLVGRWIGSGSAKLDELKWLAQHGATLSGPQDVSNNTLLHLCAIHGNSAALEACVNRQIPAEIDIHATNTQGDTALDIAASVGRVDMLKALIEKTPAIDKGIFTAVRKTITSQLQVKEKFAVLNLLFGRNKQPLTREQLDELMRLSISHDCGTDILGLLISQKNADILMRDTDGLSLLMHAVISKPDDVNLAQFLVIKGSNPKDTHGIHGATLMHYAATRSIKMVQWLDETHGLSFTAKDSESERPNQMKRSGANNVIQKHAETLIEYAKNRVAKPLYFSKALLTLDFFDDGGILLHTAASKNNVVALKEMKHCLGDAGWNAVVNTCQDSSWGKRTPLASGVRHKAINSVRYLLENGADPLLESVIDSEVSTSPCTPFAYCVAVGWTDLVKEFLPSSSRPYAVVNRPFNWRNSKKEYFKEITPLHAAIQGDYPSELCETLVKAGADVSVGYKFSDKSAVNSAVFRQAPSRKNSPLLLHHKNFLKLLLAGDNKGIISFLKTWNPTWLKVVDEETKLLPVHVIVDKKHLETLKQLLTNFESVFRPLLDAADKTRKQHTPLHHAVIAKDLKTAQWLIDQGVNKDAQDCDGNTAYHLAMLSKYDDMVSLLKKAGVRRDIKNRKGEIAEKMSVGIFSTNPEVARKQKFETAVQQGSLSTVQAMFRERSDLLHEYPDRILKMAAQYGAFEVFQFLGEEQLKIDGNDQRVRRFINEQSDLCSYNNPRYYLVHLITQTRCWDLADWYHQHGANFDRCPSGGAAYPIWLAAHNIDSDGVNKLIGFNVSVNVGGGNESTKTPLMEAASPGSGEILEALLLAGADTARTRRVEEDWGEFKNKYAHEYEDGSGYLHRKAKFVFDIIDLSNNISGDHASLPRAFDLSSLESFRVEANKKLFEELSLPGRYPAPSALEDIFTDNVFKKLLARPYKELESLSNQARENSEAYIKKKAQLFEAALGPYIARFNQLAGKNARLLMIKNSIIALQQFDKTTLGISLAREHDKSVQPHVETIVGSHHIPITGTRFNYKTMSADEFDRICQAVETVERTLPELENKFTQAKKEIFSRQQRTYGSLAQHIGEFNRLMGSLPKSVLSDSSLSNGFNSFNKKAGPCSTALRGLQGFGEKAQPVADPSVDMLANNQQHLSTLESELPNLVAELKQAEQKQGAKKEKQDKSDRLQQEKREKKAAEKLRKGVMEFVQRRLKIINASLTDFYKALGKRPNSPVKDYLRTLSEDALPKEKTYYTEELKQAIKTARESYAAVRKLFSLGDDPSFPAFKTDKPTGEKISVEGCGAFSEAADHLERSLSTLSIRLREAFQAEEKDQAQQNQKQQLLSELTNAVRNINQSAALAKKALDEKPVDGNKLKELLAFRKAIGYEQKDSDDIVENLGRIVADPGKVSDADERTLRSWIHQAGQAQLSIDTYHREFNKESAQQALTDRRNKELQQKIRHQASDISGVLNKIRAVLEGKPTKLPVPTIIGQFRTAVGCVATGVVDEVVVSEQTLGEADTRKLESISGYGVAALKAAKNYLPQVTQEKKERGVQEKKEQTLRDEISLRANEINVVLGQIRALLSEDKKKPKEVSELNNTLRSSVGCNGTHFTEVFVSAEILGQSKVLRLTDIKSYAINALRAVKGYRDELNQDHRKRVEQEGREKNIRSQISSQVKEINVIFGQIRALLSEDSKKPLNLMEIGTFRNALGSIGTNYDDINFSEDNLSSDKESKLKEIQRQGVAALNAASDYLSSLNRGHKDLIAQEKKEDGVRREISSQANEINKVLNKIRGVLGNIAPDASALSDTNAFRQAVEAESGSARVVESIAVSTTKLDPLKESGLKDIQSLVAPAMQAARAYHSRVEAESKLRREISKQTMEINSVLGQIRAALKDNLEPSALSAIDPFRQAVHSETATVEDITDPTPTLSSSYEAGLKKIQLTVGPALDAARAYLVQVNKEAQLHTQLMIDVRLLNQTLANTKSLMDSKDVIDTKALAEVTTLRQQLGYKSDDLEPVVHDPDKLSKWKEKDLTPCLQQVDKASQAANQYYQAVLSTKNAAVRKRAQLKSDVSNVNKRLTELLKLQGKTEYLFNVTKPLGEVRAALGCNNSDLKPIDINESTINDASEDRLDQLLRQVAGLNDPIGKDEAALRERNQSQLQQTVGFEVKQLNRELARLKNAPKSDTSILGFVDQDNRPNTVLGSIQSVADRIAGSKYKLFNALVIDTKKAEMIPPNEHEGLASELSRLTKLVVEKKDKLIKEAELEREQTNSKADALSKLKEAVNALNGLVEESVSTLKNGGKFEPSLVSDMEHWRKRFEKPSGLLGKKTTSTETRLQPIAFSEDYCRKQQYSMEEFVADAGKIRSFKDRLRDALSEITTVQKLQAGLKELHQQMNGQIELLPEESDLGRIPNFIKTTLIPDSERPRAASDIDDLKYAQQQATEHLKTLEGLVADHQKKGKRLEEEKLQQRKETVRKIKGEVEKLNRGMSKLRGGAGITQEDFDAPNLLGPIRAFFGGEATNPLADITISETFFDKDVPKETALAEIHNAQQAIGAVNRNIEAKRAELIEGLNSLGSTAIQELKKSATVKNTFEQRYKQMLEAKKRVTASDSKATIADLEGTKMDLEALVGSIQLAVQQRAKEKEGSNKLPGTATTPSATPASTPRTPSAAPAPTPKTPSATPASTPRTPSAAPAPAPTTPVTRTPSATPASTPRTPSAAPAPAPAPRTPAPTLQESLLAKRKEILKGKSLGEETTPSVRTSTPPTATPKKKTAAPAVTQRSVSDLQREYAGLYHSLLSQLKNQTGREDQRRAQFSNQVAAIKRDGSNANKLQAALELFRQIEASLKAPSSADEKPSALSATSGPTRLSKKPMSIPKANGPATIGSINSEPLDMSSPDFSLPDSSSSAHSTPRSSTQSSPLASDNERTPATHKAKKVLPTSSTPVSSSPSPVGSTPPLSPSSRSLSAERRKEIVANNTKLVALLEAFKRWTVDGPRYALKHHWLMFNSNGGCTAPEQHHFKYFVQYLDGVNEKVKPEISRIQQLPDTEEELHSGYVDYIQSVTRKITGIFCSLAEFGTAEYGNEPKPSNGKVLVSPRLQDGNLGSSWFPGSIANKRKALSAQAKTPAQSTTLGIYNKNNGTSLLVYSDLQTLSKAMSEFVEGQHNSVVKPDMDRLKDERDRQSDTRRRQAAKLRRKPAATPPTTPASRTNGTVSLSQSPVVLLPNTPSAAEREQKRKEQAAQRGEAQVADVKALVLEVNQLLEQAREALEGNPLQGQAALTSLKTIASFREAVGCKAKGDAEITINKMSSNLFTAKSLGEKAKRAALTYKQKAEEKKVQITALKKSVKGRSTATNGHYDPSFLAYQERIREQQSAAALDQPFDPSILPDLS